MQQQEEAARPRLPGSYPYYLANKPVHDNTDLEVIDKFTQQVCILIQNNINYKNRLQPESLRPTMQPSMQPYKKRSKQVNILF